MNLQRVTNILWSFYLIKYAMKCELVGALVIDLKNVGTLGLGNLSQVQFKLVSEVLLLRTISSTKTSLSCLKIRAIHSFDTIAFIDSSPPENTCLYIDDLLTYVFIQHSYMLKGLPNCQTCHFTLISLNLKLRKK